MNREQDGECPYRGRCPFVEDFSKIIASLAKKHEDDMRLVLPRWVYIASFAFVVSVCGFIYHLSSKEASYAIGVSEQLSKVVSQNREILVELRANQAAMLERMDEIRRYRERQGDK